MKNGNVVIKTVVAIVQFMDNNFADSNLLPSRAPLRRTSSNAQYGNIRNNPKFHTMSSCENDRWCDDGTSADLGVVPEQSYLIWKVPDVCLVPSNNSSSNLRMEQLGMTLWGRCWWGKLCNARLFGLGSNLPSPKLTIPRKAIRTFIFTTQIATSATIKSGNDFIPSVSPKLNPGDSKPIFRRGLGINQGVAR